MDVVLEGDASPADRLIVTGDTFGSSTLSVNQVGGSGASTTEGILLVQVDGTSAGTFVLDAPVVTGAYQYDLFKGGFSSPEDGDWYLRSSGFQPGASVYEALPSVLLGLNTVGTLAQRIEGRQVLAERGNGASTIASRGASGTSGQSVLPGAWLRIEGNRADMTPDASSTGVSYDQNTWRLQGGLDMMVYEGATGSLVAGINLFTGSSSADVLAVAGGGNISTDTNGIGLTATWYGNQGFYADAQLQYASLDSDLSSNVLGALTSGLDGSGRLASIEIGQEFVLPSGMALTPQAQLTWSEVSFDSFTGPNSEAVSLGDNDSLQVRLGLAAEQSWDFDTGAQARLYGIANVTHEMRDTTSVMVSGTELSASAPDSAGEVGLGGSYDWGRDGGRKSSLYGEVSASRELSGGKMRGLSGTVGFRMEF
jgi:fibronectin-binding autotransporter adhesin